ncbi:DUF6603 domain-containing protein [Spirillospora sp. NPDC029432]|uniref:DUF6603 domain-containing protein n=1 Tax=Spirillospora sp. NPDC029432 TaxID=3154599 RepID=UPI003455747E
MGGLQTWLKRLSALDELEIPEGLSTELGDLRAAIDLSVLKEWFAELPRTPRLVKISTNATKLAELSLSGTVTGTKLKSTVKFVAASDKPKAADPVAGVVVSLSLAGTEKFAFLADVLETVTLDLETRLVDGATKRRLSVSAKFPVSKDRTLTATAELDSKVTKKENSKATAKGEPKAAAKVDSKATAKVGSKAGGKLDSKAGAKSFTFSVESSVPLSVAEALYGLGFTEAQSLMFLPSFTGIALRYDVLEAGKHRVVVHSPGKKDGTVAWAAAVLPKEGEEKSRPVVASAMVPFGKKTKLSDLDLLRGQIPADCDLQVGLQAVYASQDLKVDRIKALNGALGESAAPLPEDEALEAGATLAAWVTISKKTHKMLVRKPSSKQEGKAGDDKKETGEKKTDDGKKAGAGGDTQAVQKVERTLGSLHLRQVKVRLVSEGKERTEKLVVDLDAAFVAAGFELEATGLGLEIELTEDPTVRVVLRGLGVAYARDPLHVLGTLVRRPPEGEYEFAYEGLVMVKAAKWGLMAVGSYARVKETKDHPSYASLFVFGALEGKLGGPPPVVVTGLALGFGYNSRLALPEADKVARFPFVRALGNMTELTGAEPDQPISPSKVLEKVTGGTDPVVSPADGVLWLAAGMSVSVAETVNLAGLLIVQVSDRDFLVGVLGTMSADFPARAADAADNQDVPSIAHVELGFRALYEHAERRFALTAALGDGSWVFNKDCKLTGGAALCVWFPGSVHEGDFVATVGGYHPAFTKPGHYPAVPRLGLSWSVSSAVAVKGELYVAVTPEAGMVGGRLEINYDAGGLRAWLVAYFNVIVWWAPLYFHADIGITIGASYTQHFWLFSVTIKVEVRARLQVWGPPVGGRAQLDVGPFSVTIGFGAEEDPRSRQLTWEEFRSRQLPEAPVTLSVLDGLLTDPAMLTRAAPGNWIVSTDGFAFATRTAIPATDVRYNSARQALEDEPEVGGRKRRRKKQLDVRPMGHSGSSSKGSSHTVSVAKDTGGRYQDADRYPADDWTVVPQYSAVPKALWGAVSDAPPRPEKFAEHPTEVYATGLEVRMPAPRLDGRKVDTSVEAIRDRPWTGRVNPLRHAASRCAAPSGPGVARETASKEMSEVLTGLGLLELLP